MTVVQPQAISVPTAQCAAPILLSVEAIVRADRNVEIAKPDPIAVAVGIIANPLARGDATTFASTSVCFGELTAADKAVRVAGAFKDRRVANPVADPLVRITSLLLAVLITSLPKRTSCAGGDDCDSTVHAGITSYLFAHAQFVGTVAIQL